MFLIDTEVHNDQPSATGCFPRRPWSSTPREPGAAMKKGFNPKRAETLAAQSPEMARSGEGLQNDRAADRISKSHDDQSWRTHLRADLSQKRSQRGGHGDLAAQGTRAVRVLGGECKSILNLRPFVRIPDVLASYKLMKSLNPEIVVPGHGAVSTTKIFDEYEASTICWSNGWARWRPGKIVRRNQKELKMPEYADWAGQNHLPQNITVAYESIKK